MKFMYFIVSVALKMRAAN